jgi:hypothetical protein
MAHPLEIYLADHLAGATFGVELVRRCRKNNTGSRFEEPLEQLVREIEQDKRALEEVMDTVGAKPSRAKTTGAWLFEKAQRLKPNGRLFQYTPLSRVVELETLATGIAGKNALWRALAEVDSLGGRGFHFPELARRAENQHDAVDALRLQATRLAFEPGSDSHRGRPARRLPPGA